MSVLTTPRKSSLDPSLAPSMKSSMKLSMKPAGHLLTTFRSNHIYPVTSQAFSLGRSDEEVIAAALAAGVKVIQLRDKNHSSSQTQPFIAKVRTIKKLTEAYQALLIINDNIDLALSEADGVHLGQDDTPLPLAFHKRRRAQRDHDFLIGLSTHNAAEIHHAVAFAVTHPLFYINIGPIYPTQTKPHLSTPALGIEQFKTLHGLLHHLLNPSLYPLSNTSSEITSSEQSPPTVRPQSPLASSYPHDLAVSVPFKEIDRDNGLRVADEAPAANRPKQPKQPNQSKHPQFSIPVTVMGGIKAQHLKPLIQAGAAHFAMITEITTARDIEQKVRQLIHHVKRLKTLYQEV